MYRVRRVLSSEYLMGFAVIGGFIYTNRGEFQHMWRHYLNMIGLKNDQSLSRTKVRNGQTRRHKVTETDINDCTIYYPTIDEAFGTLRTGDLVFIRYNAEKLSWSKRCKLSTTRWMSQNSYYDDVGIAYNHHNKIYILLNPTIAINSKEETNITTLFDGEMVRNGIVVMEAQDLVRNFVPDMITVKRLVCDASIRDRLEGTIKRIGPQRRSSVYSNAVDILQNWWEYLSPDGNPLFNYIQCSQLLRDDQLMQRTNTLVGSEPSNGVVAVDPNNLDQGVDNYRIDRADEIRVIRSTSGMETADNGVVDMRKACASVVKKFEKDSDATRPIKQKGYATTSFVARVYGQAGILPERFRLDSLQICHLFNVDCLPGDSSEHSVTRRLSHPFHIYSGNVYRTRFDNLKELSDIDILGNRM